MKRLDINKNLFFSKNDSADPRLGDWASSWDESVSLSTKNYVAILGYPDDRGISANGGRPGAQAAPDQIRKFLYKLTPHIGNEKSFQIQDCGNLQTTSDLKSTHEAAKSLMQQLLGQFSKVLILGGGHDYGYPDGAAFVNWARTQGQKPVVINFDAHLDVRPLKDTPHSGTPFYRLLSEFPGLDFVALGIQPQCNSREHLKWLKAQGGIVFTADEMSDAAFLSQFETLLQNFESRPCFFSVDIDGFSSDAAPGCSQSWATGLAPNLFFKVFELIKSHLLVKQLGIYEVSPPLDIGDQTSKLAAVLAHRWMFT